VVRPASGFRHSLGCDVSAADRALHGGGPAGTRPVTGKEKIGERRYGWRPLRFEAR